MASKGGRLKIFTPNRKFRKAYDALYKKDPLAANLYLLMNELANENGEIEANDDELYQLMEIRFNDPEEYAFGKEGIYKTS